MMLHLPIVILTSLSPIPISDAVPRLDIAKECRFEGGTTVIVDRCSRDLLASANANFVKGPFSTAF